MEFLLLWWDNLDDLTHAARHLVGSAMTEVAEATTSLATSATAALALLLLRLQG